MSLTTSIYYHIEDINSCGSSTLSNILVTVNNLYSTITSIVRTNDYLLLTDVPAFFSIFDNVYTSCTIQRVINRKFVSDI